MKVTNSQ